MTWIDDLSLAQQLAEAADSISARYYAAGSVPTRAKADGSPVTDADREVERVLRARLASERPQDAFLGEEFGGGDSDGRRWGGRRWVVDPVDGTANFAAGRPEWSTLIALETGGEGVTGTSEGVTGTSEVVTGMISAPALRRRWWATRASGAWTAKSTESGMGRPEALAVSGTATLAECTAAYWPAWDWVPASRLAAAKALLGVCLGGGPLSDWPGVCQGAMLVASGEADVFLHLTAEPWDLAAAVPVVEEAGGRFSDFAGGRSITTGAGLFTNGRVHEEVLDLLAPVLHIPGILPDASQSPTEVER
jgi:histidinol-phosphatase